MSSRRPKGKHLENYWEFPGGKLEENETLFQCLERELKEELTINTQAKDILTRSMYTYEHGKFEIVAIRTTIISGSITLSVHDKAKWVDINQLVTYSLLPADISIAKYLISATS